MRKNLAVLALAEMLLVASAFATDIGASFAMSNLYFPWDSTSATDSSVTNYPADSYFFGGGGSVTTPLNDNLTLMTSYSITAVQRSKMSALVKYSSGALEIAMGPAFGIYNDLENPIKAGFSSSVKVTVPGKLFLFLKNESSLGSGLAAVGDYTQEYNELRFGWYVRNAICSLGVKTQKYQDYVSDSLTTTDSVVDYFFDVDIFKKNQPYNVLLTLGYRYLSKDYVESAASAKDSLGSIILGTQVTVKPDPAFDIILGLDSAVYTFGFDNLSARGPSDSSYLFSAQVGIVVRPDKFAANTVIP
jgi:hypothetical protein